MKKQIASQSYRETDLARGPQTSLGEVEKIAKVLEELEPVGRMVIDLPAILNNDPEALFSLEDEDILYIPGKPQAVHVVGMVQHESSHFYNSSFRLDDYLELAGGLKQQADEDRIYVIKANGAVFTAKRNLWFASKETLIEPGDTIVVPINGRAVDNITLWTRVTQILYQTAIAIAALQSL